MPSQKAASWPKLLQYTPGNIPPGCEATVMEHPRDKALFLQTLKQKEMARRGTNDVARLMEGSEYHTFFEMSLHMKAVHHEWAKLHPHTEDRCRSAYLQLSYVVQEYPDLDNDRSQTVKMELERRLCIVENHDSIR
jgi:hypothetical protein